VGPVGILKHAGNIGSKIVSDVECILQYCLYAQVPLIYISTSEVYGDVLNMTEDATMRFYPDYKVRTEYAAAKLLAEIMISNTAKIHNFKYQIIRPFNVSGPRQRPDGGFVLPRFVIGALTGQSLTVYGNGSQRRAFTDVRDICRAILMISKLGNWNQIWNIGNPNNLRTIYGLAEQVRAKTRSKSEIIFVDPAELHGPLFSEAWNKIPEVSKLHSLGWCPQYSFNETLDDLVTYYKTKISAGYRFDVQSNTYGSSQKANY